MPPGFTPPTRYGFTPAGTEARFVGQRSRKLPSAPQTNGALEEIGF